MSRARPPYDRVMTLDEVMHIVDVPLALMLSIEPFLGSITIGVRTDITTRGEAYEILVGTVQLGPPHPPFGRYLILIAPTTDTFMRLARAVQRTASGFAISYPKRREVWLWLARR